MASVGSWHACRLGARRARGPAAAPPRPAPGSRGRPPAKREVSGVILLHMVSHFN